MVVLSVEEVFPASSGSKSSALVDVSWPDILRCEVVESQYEMKGHGKRRGLEWRLFAGTVIGCDP
jgi:hypothetical protein